MSSLYSVKTGIMSGDVILVGDFEVGKTSFFCRAQCGRFNVDNSSFIGGSFNSVASIYYDSYRVLKNGHEIKVLSITKSTLSNIVFLLPSEM